MLLNLFSTTSPFGLPKTIPELKYMRKKDIGTKLQPPNCYEKVISDGEYLEKDTVLTARTKYYFVSQMHYTIKDYSRMFSEFEDTIHISNDTTYYVYVVEIKNKEGTFKFEFSDGSEIQVNVKRSSDSQPNNNNSNVSWPEDQDINMNDIPLQPLANDNTNLPTINILLVVPSTVSALIGTILCQFGFIEKEGNCYFQIVEAYARRVILLYPFNNQGIDILVLREYSFHAHYVIVLLKLNYFTEDLAEVTQLNNLRENPVWLLQRTKLQGIELDGINLPPKTQALLKNFNQTETFIDEFLSIVTCSTIVNIEKNFEEFLQQWLLQQLDATQYRTVGLKFVDPFKPLSVLSEEAARRFNAESFEAYGSVIVYILCSTSMYKYIQQHTHEIFNTLAEDGLTSIYECFVNDIEASIQRPENTEFIEKLEYLKEQMKRNSIPDQPKGERFQAISPIQSVHCIPYEELYLNEEIRPESSGIAYAAKWREKEVVVMSFKQNQKKIVMKEAAKIVHLHHKCVITWHGITTDPRTNWTMAVLEDDPSDKSLYTLLYQDRLELSDEDYLKIALDVAESLSYLHSQNIIHGEVNSANTIVHMTEGTHGSTIQIKIAKLGGLGEANLMVGSKELQKLASPMRSIAPELQEKPQLSKASDIYSFGVLIFEMLTKEGTLMFNGQLQSQLSFPQNLFSASHLYKKLWNLIPKCCCTDPNQRITAAECIKLLNDK